MLIVTTSTSTTTTYDTVMVADTFNDLGLPCNGGISCPPSAMFPPDCCGSTGSLEYFTDSAIRNGQPYSLAGVNFQSIYQSAQLKFNTNTTLDIAPEVQAVFQINGQYVGNTSFKPKYIGQSLVITATISGVTNNYAGTFASGTISLTIV